MKYILIFFCLNIFILNPAQKKTLSKKAQIQKKNVVAKINPDLMKSNDSIPALIPQKINGKYGYINQKSKVIINPEYSNVGFFTEDCNLLHSPNKKTRIYGSDQFASVRRDGIDFRISKSGKRVYRFKEEDLGKCKSEFKAQLFHGYILNKNYGIIEDSRFTDGSDYRQFTIYPQYDYLHIMEGDDLKNPMIVAVRNNKFGVIDIENRTVIPFEYTDIKRNYSWKLARLFEVSRDGLNYFYIDIANQKYQAEKL